MFSDVYGPLQSGRVSVPAPTTRSNIISNTGKAINVNSNAKQRTMAVIEPMLPLKLRSVIAEMAKKSATSTIVVNYDRRAHLLQRVGNSIEFVHAVIIVSTPTEQLGSESVAFFGFNEKQQAFIVCLFRLQPLVFLQQRKICTEQVLVRRRRVRHRRSDKLQKITET